MKYMFKFKLFGSKVQMFSEDQRGIVIEKSRMLYAYTQQMKIIKTFSVPSPFVPLNS